MNHFILCSAPTKTGTSDVTMQYDTEEMAEIFEPHEQMWLAQGKKVEREHHGVTFTYVDLAAFYNKNK